ncbi:MAG: RpiB/LacA/LacB family sugar-phosphate isomerase [Deltaproteobacteria bacterium]|nr:RpiB/LacA/LacB family sugar-phosphate isomerase [Deltaproteobacteria bacterium]
MQRVRSNGGQVPRRQRTPAPDAKPEVVTKKRSAGDPHERIAALRRAALEAGGGQQRSEALTRPAPIVRGELPVTLPLAAHQLFEMHALGAESAAVTALQGAGLGPTVVDVGPRRTVGVGITVPLMTPLPSIELGAYLDAPPTRDLSKLRIAVSADHGGYGKAEATAAALKELGVGDVVIIAPRQGERMNYGVSTHAALELKEQGKVDHVVCFCGNGLGALDVANLHAFADPPRIAPPVYGDNLWTIVEGQARGADMLALGARLLGDDAALLKAYLKAFLDEPPAPLPGGTPMHGVSSKLVDPKPERIAGRTLASPIGTLVKLDANERARAAARPTTVYFNPSDEAVPAQLTALKQWLPKTVRFQAWEGDALPKVNDGERALLLSQHGCREVSTHPWGFFTPEHEPNSEHRVHRAEHVKSVAAFVRDSAGAGGLTLDLPSGALSDAACGGAAHDLLKLLVKTFLLAEQGEAGAHKALYGEALQFGTAMLAQGAPPPELASWGEALEAARRGARSG